MHQHKTFTMPVPQDIKKQFEKSTFLRKYIELKGEAISPWEKAVTEEYAKAIMDYELSKFIYESINKPYAEEIKYSHHIECDDKMLSAVRLGSEHPSVIERMRLNYNFKS